MIDWGAAALLLMGFAAAPAPVAALEPLRFAQITVREQIIVRVPVRPRSRGTAPIIDWKEGRGPRCVAAKSIAGAALLGQNSVDLLLRDHSRIRARLENACPALDYYYGFYIRPGADGRVCADRDTIRSRMGGQCEIDAFRSLRPVARR